MCQRTLKKYAFYIYAETLSKIHALPPYTAFEQYILDYLLLPPTQLHPNGWAFLRAYQIVLEHLSCTVSGPLFYALFTFVHSRKNTSVSFRVAEKSFFRLYSDSIKDFKTHYACVVAMNLVAKKRVSKCEQGVIVSSKFPLSWSKHHYPLHPSDFLVSPENLDLEDQ